MGQGVESITDEVLRATLRRRSLTILLASLIRSAVLTALACLLP